MIGRSQRSGRRVCPACGVANPAVTARWCGECGAALTGEVDRDGPARGRWRWALPAVLAVAAAAVLATTGVAAVVDRLVTGSDRLEVDVDRGEVGDEDGPVCLRDPDCVAWVAPASVAGRTAAATVAGDLTLVRVGDGLEARETDTGALRWQLPLASPFGRNTHLPVVATDDLALATDVTDTAGALVAQDLATGDARWRVTGVTEFGAVVEHPDVLLALVTRSGTEQVIAIAPSSGAVRWSVAGRLLHLVDDAVIVVEDGEVAVLDPTGDERWRRPLEDDAAWLDVTGRFLRLFDGQGNGGPVWSLVDGEVLEVGDGELVPVADVAGHPQDPFASGLAALTTPRDDGATDLVFIDGDEPAWSVTFERLGCCAPLQLEDGHLAVPASDGGRWLLDRADGTVLDRSDPPPGRASASAYLPNEAGFSVQELDHAAATTSDLALVEDGQRTARLPAGTWPVGASDEVVVLRSHTWIAAIHRAEGTPAEDEPGQ